MAASRVQVVIRGRTYQLAGGHPEHTRSLARVVDETMAQFSEQMVGVDNYHLAILTALHLADELSGATSKVERYRSRVGALVARVNDTLDAALADEDAETDPEPAADSSAIARSAGAAETEASG